MTMYHMAMPPHMGGPHPPTVHSQLFPTPILPSPMPHSYAMHAFPGGHLAASAPSSHMSSQQHQQHQQQQQHHSSVAVAAVGAASVSLPVGTGNSALLTHPSPMLSQPSPVYPPQTSVYVNPYLASTLPHTHGHPPHQHPAPVMYGIPSGVSPGPPPGMMPGPPQHSGGLAPNAPPGPVMSVDEELMEEMNALHLGYIETEDSPHKLEQREKLERVIMEYLTITPHSHKFIFHQIGDVLENSVSTMSEFSAYSAACAFDALAQYAANLIAQPWRREYRQIKLYSGFWVHQVCRHLAGAECILSLMGYLPRHQHRTSDRSDPTSRPDPTCLALEGVLDPDLISRLALDCLIAYCECQVMKKISEGVREFGLTWRQILHYRQLHAGGVDVTVRHLLFTLRQRLHPPPPPQLHLDTSQHRQPTTSSSNGPPLPVRQSSIGSSSPSSLSTPHHQPNPSPPDKPPLEQPRSIGGGGGGISGGTTSGEQQRGGSSNYHHHHHHHHQQPQHHHMLHHTPPSTTAITTTAPSITTTASHHPHHHHHHHGSPPLTLPVQPPAPPLSYSRSADTPDTGKSILSSSLGSMGVGLGGQVPTAKLIDLDSSSHEALISQRPSHLLPKVLPHKRSAKVMGPGGRVLPPLDTPDDAPPPPPPPPPEVFQAGTLDEHLEATLSLVKDPNRNSANIPASNDQGANSWESWDFVYRGLEKRGYNKDIGDRGDILHQITRQNLCPPEINNKNANMNNKKDMAKSKPMSINQALQAIALNEPRERMERNPASSKSSHSISHGPEVFPNLTKRNSLYDNLSTGFETAPQDSDDYEDRKPVLKKTCNLNRTENRLDPSGKNNMSAAASSPSPRSLSISSKGSHPRHHESDASRSSTSAPTLQPTTAATTTTAQTSGGTSAWGRDGMTAAQIVSGGPSAWGNKDAQAPRDNLPLIPWSCTYCTFLNDKCRTACDMCGKSRMPGPEVKPLISGGRQCPQCTLINERAALDCSACGVHLEGSSTYI